MRLTTALAHEFTRSTRDRGEAYAAAGRVRLIEASGRQVEALVRGTSVYHVILVRSNDRDGYVGFGGSCECPHARGEQMACKHLWATPRVAEERGYLAEGPALDAGRTYLDVLPPDDELLEALDPDELVSLDLPVEPAPAGTTPASRLPARSSSRVLLEAMEEVLDAGEQAQPPGFRYAAGELMYVIDLVASGDGRSLSVLLQHRVRKKSGDWGKAKPASLSSREVLAAPEPDRRALAPLFGATRAYGTYAVPSLGYDPYGGVSASAFALTDALVPVVLPAMASTGRLYLRDRPEPEPVRPIAWDDGPVLVDRERLAESSAKLDVLVPRLLEIAEEGHKALVFSQFTSLLAILRTRLEAEGLVYEYLDGRTKHRGPRVERFQQDPTCPLFLISLKAGGVGLNLTAAEYVFLLDPWWNPAVEAQAIDRTHRIGQTREVFAYRLIASDTVEEKVLELQQRKRALADAILHADATGLRQLSREDLDILLS